MIKEKQLVQREERTTKALRKNIKVKVGDAEYSLGEFYKSDDLKKQLVRKNPLEAEQLYYHSRDYELGRLFALTYNGHLEYGAAAFHIARELGILGIRRPHSDVVNSIKEEEEKIFKKVNRKKSRKKLLSNSYIIDFNNLFKCVLI